MYSEARKRRFPCRSRVSRPHVLRFDALSRRLRWKKSNDVSVVRKPSGNSPAWKPGSRLRSHSFSAGMPPAAATPACALKALSKLTTTCLDGRRFEAMRGHSLIAHSTVSEP